MRGVIPEAAMPTSDWTLRARLFAQRFWQPTSACIACMPGSFGAATNLVHWQIALTTGFATGVLVLLLSFTPVIVAFRRRVSNALVVGGLTAIGDAFSHWRHGSPLGVEVLVTGAVSAVFAFAASFLFEERGRRVRGAWRRVRRKPG